MKNVFNFTLMTIMGVFLLWSCTKDPFADKGGSIDEEGVSTVTLDFRFEGLNNALATRGVNGDLDFAIENLVVLFYEAGQDENASPKFVRNFTTFDYLDSENRDPAHCEELTYHGSVKFEIENGSYRIYAVANVEESRMKKDDNEYFSEKELREIQIKWEDYEEDGESSRNPSDYKIPNAMFGYFKINTGDHTEEKYRNVIHHNTTQGIYPGKESTWDSDNSPSLALDHIDPNRAPVVTINKRNNELHAWLKRVVSKLTIGFDGSGLYPDVEIYIKSVSIHDVAGTCFLGHDNSVGDLNDVKNKKVEFYKKQTEPDQRDQRLNIIYSTDGGAIGDAITRDKPAFPRGDELDENLMTDSNYDENKEFNDINGDGWHDKWYDYVHGSVDNTNPRHNGRPITLYFMENLQGVVSDESPKTANNRDHYGPNGTHDNEEDTCPFYKDGKPDGTYVEVKAYYRNTRRGQETEGNITYRFMLGKNTTNDFNAERNCHYKLILSFLGDANNVDWHIDYEEYVKPREEGFYFRIPYNLADDAADYGYMDKSNNEYWYENENWKQSYVWYAYDEGHNPIAEIVKEVIYYDAYEYKTGDPRNERDVVNPILRKFYQVVTIYPMDSDGDTDFSSGIIAQVLACDSDEPGIVYKTKKSGAKISMCWRHQKNTNVPSSSQHRGDCAIKSCELNNDIATGNDELSHENYFYAKYNPTEKTITLIDTPLNTKLDTRPYKEKDIDGNLYSIVKIGTSYWFRENLRTTHYLEGPEIFPYEDNIPPKTNGDVYLAEGKAMYKNDPKYGYLYNLAALTMTSDLDPYLFGWAASNNQAVLMQKDTEDSSGKTFWQYNGQNHEVDYRIAPEGWHIPVNCLIAELGIFYNRTADQDYLVDYLSDNYARAIVDTDKLKWPSFPSVTQPNLSGLSLLAIPADGKSESIKIDYDISAMKSGDLSNVAVPFWLDTFIKPNGENYFYATPRFLHINKEYYLEETLVNGYASDKEYLPYFKEISKQYLPIRPCRNVLVFRPRYWSEIGDWAEVPNRNTK